MENLNKQQLVLLTILVSFVTSIATGITTVSLLDSSAPSINQTINRVVEKTIETVTPVEVTKEVIKEVPKEVTVVVREEDETIKALEKNTQSIVRIKSSSETDAFYGLGIVVNKDGLIIADKNNIPVNGKLSGVFANGTFPLTLVSSDDKEDILILKPEITDVQVGKFIPVTFANSDVIRLGQTVVAVSGQNKNIVSIGIVSGVGERDGPTINGELPKKQVYSIDTSFSLGSVTSGTPLINLAGEIIAIKVGNGTGEDVFKASNIIKDFARGKI